MTTPETSWACKVHEGTVSIEFPDEGYKRGQRIFPNWSRTLLRDEEGNVKVGVREFTLTMNSDGLAEVRTIELVDEQGSPLTGGNGKMLLEDGEPVEREFSYLLTGVTIRQRDA
jgi:hypothetical protein